MKVRASKTTVEGGLDEDTTGVGVRQKKLYVYRRNKRGQYTDQYPPGVEIDPISDRPYADVRYEKRAEYYMGLPTRYQPSDATARRTLKDRMSQGFFDRDIRILTCIGVVIVVFVLCYTLLNMVFDSLIDIATSLSITTTNLTTFRTEATLVLGTVVAIIVGAGAAMFLFKEDEVNDTIFEA